MIEARYHVRVDFEYPKYDPQMGYTERTMKDDQIGYKLFAASEKAEAMELNLFVGNAACSPYLTCWCSSYEDAERAERELINLLRDEGCTLAEDK